MRLALFGSALTNGWRRDGRRAPTLVNRGYLPKTVNLWSGTELTEVSKMLISAKCRTLQDAMLVWGRGGVPVIGDFDGTLDSLVRCYKTDPDSTITSCGSRAASSTTPFAGYCCATTPPTTCQTSKPGTSCACTRHGRLTARSRWATP
jgi:hypothetical protein